MPFRGPGARPTAERREPIVMTRVVKEADERRAELLETGMRLFADLGYDQTSVQDITDAIGVAKGTFYHYFRSKDEMLDELSDWKARELLAETLAETATLGGDPVARVRALTNTVVQWKMEAESELTLTYLHEMYREENLGLRTRLIGCYLERIRPEFASALQDGAALGVFDIGDVDATTDIVLAMWRGITDHLADLLLASEGHPERVRRVLAHISAIETAMERVLGMEPGTLGLYDRRRLKATLEHLAGHAVPATPSVRGGAR
jgi:AcrR family transcriptional regulator